jgi:hypothetical protein
MGVIGGLVVGLSVFFLNSFLLELDCVSLFFSFFFFVCLLVWGCGFYLCFSGCVEVIVCVITTQQYGW